MLIGIKVFFQNHIQPHVVPIVPKHMANTFLHDTKDILHPHAALFLVGVECIGNPVHNQVVFLFHLMDIFCDSQCLLGNLTHSFFCIKFIEQAVRNCHRFLDARSIFVHPDHFALEL